MRGAPAAPRSTDKQTARDRENKRDTVLKIQLDLKSEAGKHRNSIEGGW